MCDWNGYITEGEVEGLRREVERLKAPRPLLGALLTRNGYITEGEVEDLRAEVERLKASEAAWADAACERAAELDDLRNALAEAKASEAVWTRKWIEDTNDLEDERDSLKAALMANGPGCLHDPCSEALCAHVHELESALAEADADRLVKQARIEELERALGLSSTVTVPPLPYFHEPPEGPVP